MECIIRMLIFSEFVSPKQFLACIIYDTLGVKFWCIIYDTFFKKLKFLIRSIHLLHRKI